MTFVTISWIWTKNCMSKCLWGPTTLLHLTHDLQVLLKLQALMAFSDHSWLEFVLFEQWWSALMLHCCILSYCCRFEFSGWIKIGCCSYYTFNDLLLQHEPGFSFTGWIRKKVKFNWIEFSHVDQKVQQFWQNLMFYSARLVEMRLSNIY